MQATVAERAVTKSMPPAIRPRVKMTTVMKYTKIKAITAIAVRSDTERLFSFTVRTALGCSSSDTSRRLNLASTRARAILMPPPIEPVLASTLERKNIHSVTRSGQRAKSALAKPLARPMEMKLKPA